MRAWSKANRASVRATRARANAHGFCRNHSERPVVTKKYCAECRDKNNAIFRKWYEQNKATHGYARTKAWRTKNHPQWLIQARSYDVLRQARVRASGGKISRSEWELIKSRQENRCFDCGSESKLTIGHVLPVSRGGSSHPRNIIGQCHPCNRKQHNKVHWLFMTAQCVGERAAA